MINNEIVTISKSQRGNELIWRNNYKYVKRKPLQVTNEIRWRCPNKTCRAYLTTARRGALVMLSKVNDRHSHPSYTDEEKQRMITSSKKKDGRVKMFSRRQELSKWLLMRNYLKMVVKK